jgi:hypothetical protein
MPANTSPIFTVSGDINWTDFIHTAVSGTAVSAYNGTSAHLIYTAGDVGGFVNKVVCEAGGLGNNVASVLRIYINNGSDNTVSSNNVLYYQYALPATTRSDTVATAHIEIPLSLQLPRLYRLYVSISTNTANLSGGWRVTAIGGDY